MIAYTLNMHSTIVRRAHREQHDIVVSKSRLQICVIRPKPVRLRSDPTGSTPFDHIKTHAKIEQGCRISEDFILNDVEADTLRLYERT